jgi:peroxin-4
MLANPGIDSPLNVDVAALLRSGDAVGAESLVRWAVSEPWGRYEGK